MSLFSYLPFLRQREDECVSVVSHEHKKSNPIQSNPNPIQSNINQRKRSPPIQKATKRRDDILILLCTRTHPNINRMLCKHQIKRRFNIFQTVVLSSSLQSWLQLAPAFVITLRFTKAAYHIIRPYYPILSVIKIITTISATIEPKMSVLKTVTNQYV